MNDKKEFIIKNKERTKQFAVEIIQFCDSLKACKASAVITYQLVKSATSTGANYRAACIARSQKEFFSKLCIVVEESDESAYWLEIIEDSELSNNKEDLARLRRESVELVKLMTKAKNTLYNRKDVSSY